VRLALSLSPKSEHLSGCGSGCWYGRAAVVSATLDALLSWQGEAGAHVGSRPSLAGLLQNCRPALAGIIGARCEFTAAMISSVSIPCR
jgi:hypothetical protein